MPLRSQRSLCHETKPTNFAPACAIDNDTSMRSTSSTVTVQENCSKLRSFHDTRQYSSDSRQDNKLDHDERGQGGILYAKDAHDGRWLAGEVCGVRSQSRRGELVQRVASRPTRGPEPNPAASRGPISGFQVDDELDFARCELHTNRPLLHGCGDVLRNASAEHRAMAHNSRSQPQVALTAPKLLSAPSAAGTAEFYPNGEFLTPRTMPLETQLIGPSPEPFLCSQRKFLKDLAEAEQHWKNLQSNFNEALGLGSISHPIAAVPAGVPWRSSGNARW